MNYSQQGPQGWQQQGPSPQQPPQPGPYGPPQQPSFQQQAMVQSQLKNEGTALLLAVLITGGSRFYLGNVGSGLLHLCTLGLLGVGWIYDIATAKSRCRAHNQKILNQVQRF